jgi:hypothetical protein
VQLQPLGLCMLPAPGLCVSEGWECLVELWLPSSGVQGDPIPSMLSVRIATTMRQQPPGDLTASPSFVAACCSAPVASADVCMGIPWLCVGRGVHPQQQQQRPGLLLGPGLSTHTPPWWVGVLAHSAHTWLCCSAGGYSCLLRTCSADAACVFAV